MTETKHTNASTPKKTSIHWRTLLFSWIPFLGLVLSLYGVIRSIISITASRKIHKTDKKAVVGLFFSSVALIISIIVLNVILNPSPSITLEAIKGTIQTNDDKYALTGRVTNAENGKLIINGTPVPVAYEKFSHTVTLREGDNTFTIIATNGNGSSEKTIKIHRATKAELQARANMPKHSFNDFYNWINSDSGYSGCGAGGECTNWAYIDGKCSLFTRKANNDLVSYFDRACLQESYKDYIKLSAFDVGTSKDGDVCDSDVSGYYHYLCSSFGDMITAIKLADGYSHSSKDEANKYKQEAETIYNRIAITSAES